MKRRTQLEQVFQRVTPSTKRPKCRVTGCDELVALHPSGIVAAHGFCPWHVMCCPPWFVPAWERATSTAELERVWEKITDEFAFLRGDVAAGERLAADLRAERTREADRVATPTAERVVVDEGTPTLVRAPTRHRHELRPRAHDAASCATDGAGVEGASGEVVVVGATKARKRVRKEQLEGDELAAEVLRRKHPPSEKRISRAAGDDGGEGERLAQATSADHVRRRDARKPPSE